MKPIAQLCVALAVFWATATMAEQAEHSGLAPLPAEQFAPPPPMTSIANGTPDASILTTHDLPQPAMPEGVAPFQRAEPLVAPATTPAAPMTTTTAAPPPKPAAYKPNIPFGRGEAASMPVIPSGPHMTHSMPVVTVDAVEASEPAPPTPIAPEADPVAENPEEPTDLTSPIFVAEEGTLSPRKIVLRALNKVTAQSETLSLKPGQKIQFGRLEITAITCQISSPTSQTDYAGLLDIAEKSPAAGAVAKPLFHGWMYASSPSIAALEHPIYDITMVECSKMPSSQAVKSDDEPAKKPAKKHKS